MAQEILKDGSPYGEQRRKINDNFTELYTDTADNATNISNLQAEATAKWVLLNTVDNRSRSNETRIDAIETTGAEVQSLPYTPITDLNNLQPGIYYSGSISHVSNGPAGIATNAVLMIEVKGHFASSAMTQIIHVIGVSAADQAIYFRSRHPGPGWQSWVKMLTA